MSDRNKVLEAALSYVARGWHVFPVHGILQSGHCTCRNVNCKNPGKHPRNGNGERGASNDVAVVTAWFTANPNSNIAIATGPSGLAVLDIDVANGKVGAESLAKLEDQYEPIPETLESCTGSGGQHLLFERPQGVYVKPVGSKLGANIDIKASKGYIIAPPSRHASGGAYQWVNDAPLAPLPEWVITALEAADRKHTATDGASVEHVPGVGAGVGFEGWLELIGDHAGGMGFHEPIRNAVMSFVARHGACAEAVAYLKERLRARVEEADKSAHSLSYVYGKVTNYAIDDSVRGALRRLQDEAAAALDDAPDAELDARAQKKVQWIIPNVPPAFYAPDYMTVEDANAELDASVSAFLRHEVTRVRAVTAYKARVEAAREAAEAEYGDTEDEGAQAAIRRHMERARRVIAADVRRMFGIQTWGKPQRIALRGSAGLGKTSAVVKAIASIPELLDVDVDIYVSRRGLAKDYADEFDAVGFKNYAVISGRDANNCRRHKVVSSLSEKKAPVKALLCNGCPFADECEYMAQYLDAAPKVRIYTHQHLSIPRTLDLQRAKIVFVDENTTTALQVAPVSVELSKATLIPAAMVREGKPLLAAVRDAITDKSELVNAARAIRKAVFDAGLHGGLTDRQFTDGMSNLPDLALAELYEALARELDFDRDHARGVLVCGDRLRVLRYNFPIMDGSTGFCIIDADADYRLNSLIFGRHTQTEIMVKRRIGRHVQVYSTSFSDMRLNPEKGNAEHKEAAFRNHKQIAQFIEATAKKYKRTLVVMPKMLRELMFKNVDVDTKKPLSLDGGIVVAHHGAVKGIDKWIDENGEEFKGQEFGCVICVGRNEPSVEAVEEAARALLASTDTELNLTGKYVRKYRGYRTRDGRYWGKKVWCHEDATVQSLLELSRERQSGQVIDRARLLRRAAGDEPDIYTLTSLPLDIEVDELVTWEELRNGGSKERRALEWSLANKRALVLSAKWMGENMPEISGAPRSAKALAADLKAVFKVQRSNNIFLLDRCTLNMAAATKQGQRGGHDVYVLAPDSIGSLRALAEAELGPLKTFEMVEPEPIDDMDDEEEAMTQIAPVADESESGIIVPPWLGGAVIPFAAGVFSLDFNDAPAQVAA